MAREGRLLIEDVCYHVITRGNQRQKVFHEDHDYYRYLESILLVKKRFSLRIYGYCLMSNHIHLIVDPEEMVLLPKAMQSINQSYARYYNYVYKQSGHLWQCRYKSFVISKDRYLIDCIAYIEQNPVRANMVQSPLEYRWSSYKNRIMGLEDEVLDSIEL